MSRTLSGGPAVTALCRRLIPGGRNCTAATDPIDPAGLAAEPVIIFLHPDGPRLAGIVAEVAAGAIDVPIARRMSYAEAAEAQELVAAGGLRWQDHPALLEFVVAFGERFSRIAKPGSMPSASATACAVATAAANI